MKIVQTLILTAVLVLLSSGSALAIPVHVMMNFQPAGWAGEFIYEDASGFATPDPGIIRFDVISFEITFSSYSGSEQDILFSVPMVYSDPTGKLALDFRVQDTATGIAILGDWATNANIALDASWVGIPDCGSSMYEYSATVPIQTTESAIPEPHAAALFGSEFLLIFTRLRGSRQT